MQEYTKLEFVEWVSIILFLLTCAFACGLLETLLESWQQERKTNKEVKRIQKQVDEINKQREKLSRLVLERK